MEFAPRGRRVARPLPISRSSAVVQRQVTAIDTRRRVLKQRAEDTNMVNVIKRMRALVHGDEGQDLIEYALLAG